MQYDNELSQLQADALEFIRAHETLASVDAMTEERKDLTNEINKALRSLGLVLVINTAVANATRPNQPGPTFDQIQFSVDVIENVLLNRAATGSGIPALSAAYEVARALHWKQPSIGSGTIYVRTPTIQFVNDNALLMYRVNFQYGIQ